MPGPGNWAMAPSANFKKLYKGKEEALRDKIDKKLRDLSASKDPLSLGEKKRGLGIWSLRVDRAHRIGFVIDSEGGVICLLKVCSHKEVYGHD